MTPARAIIYGGLTVGVLDGLDAIVFFGVRNGVDPLRIFKGIAGGMLGREAVAAAFVSHGAPLRVGPLYGILVYLTMNLVVLPLSALHGTGLPSAVPVVLNGILIHIIGVGTPSALFARAATPLAQEAP